MRVGSLFSGFGLLDLGLQRAGMQIAFQVEIEDYAQRILARHFPAATRYRDVRDVGAHNLAPVDLIAGGFPCTDISNAGLRAGLDGEHSGLWREQARIIGELRPRYVLVENVKALLGRGFGRVLGDLAALGYDTEWACIPACVVGAPHIRDRLWLVAYPNATGLERPRGERNTRTGWAHVGPTDCNPAAIAQGQRRGMGRTGRSVGGTAWPLGDERPLPAVADPDFQGLEVGQIFGGNARAELAALERNTRTADGLWATQPGISGVDDGTAKRMERIRGLGNGVVVQVAEWIGRRIMADAAIR